jgi:hypothetical protein
MLSDKDFKKILELMPKFQTDREWLEQYRRESNQTLAALGLLTAGIFIAIFVMAALHRT